ncbi:MAG: hypothetical protein HY348_09510 [Nitrospira defluvii]|nr:hypothetical protein [Nitrospira defluvii]
MMNWRTITDPAIYRQQRFDEISLLEGVRQFAYLDTARPSRPSIGIGFNLKDSGVRTQVFEVMQINAQDPRLSPAQQASEQGYINQLVVALSLTYLNDAALQLALNNIMIQRSIDPILANQAHITGRSSFDLQPTDIQTAYNNIILTFCSPNRRSS